VFDLGRVFAKPFFDTRHVRNARHDDKALPAAMMFAQQCLAHHHIVPLHHIGAHGEPVDRRGLDGGEFAQARHRHLQRARDGRGGECEDVNIGAQLFQLFLVSDAEALFFIDDHKAEVLELRRFGQDRVGADHQIDLAIFQPFAGRGRFLGGDEAREPPDLEREACEAFDKVLIVLAREQGGGGHNRHLLPRHCRDECGAQGDLGLAEADIAAHQPIHRTPAFQIAQHIGDGAFLILGLRPWEAVDELVERGVIGRQHGGFAQRTRGGDLHQFARDGGDAFFQLGTAALPCLTAQPIERNRLFGRAIARENIDIFDRDEQLVPARIFQRDAIMLAFADRDRVKPEIAPDPVFDMHHQIAARQGLKLGKEGIGIAALFLAAHQPVAQHIGFCEEIERVAGKPGFQRQDNHRAIAFGGQPQRVLPIFRQHRRRAGFFKD